MGSLSQWLRRPEEAARFVRALDAHRAERRSPRVLPMGNPSPARQERRAATRA